jgi:hypothetical protein
LSGYPGRKRLKRFGSKTLSPLFRGYINRDDTACKSGFNRVLSPAEKDMADSPVIMNQKQRGKLRQGEHFCEVFLTEVMPAKRSCIKRHGAGGRIIAPLENEPGIGIIGSGAFKPDHRASSV